MIFTYFKLNLVIASTQAVTAAEICMTVVHDAYAFQQTLNDARSTIEYHVNMRAPPKNTQPQKNTQ